MKSSYILSIIVFLAVNMPLYADGLKIEPGLWEITTTTASAMAPPQINTIRECLQKDTINPKEMIQDLPEDCTLDSKVSGNKLTYELTCDRYGTVMVGSGSMESNGDTMRGKIQFDSNMNGMSFKMFTETEGKRIDDC